MKNLFFIPSFAVVIMISLCACDEEPDLQRKLELKATGFSGTLPDGRTFGEEDIVARNGLVGHSHSREGSYISHILSILDSASAISIAIELPYVKYSDDYIRANDSIINDAAKKYYSPQIVKEKLSVGDKFLLSPQTDDISNTFRVLVLDQKNYSGFTSDGTLDQTGSYLKVIELEEGTASDPDSGSIKTIEVIFDLDVKLRYVDPDNNIEEGRLTGLLRMKYQEKYR